MINMLVQKYRFYNDIKNMSSLMWYCWNTAQKKTLTYTKICIAELLLKNCIQSCVVEASRKLLPRWNKKTSTEVEEKFVEKIAFN